MPADRPTLSRLLVAVTATLLLSPAAPAAAVPASVHAHAAQATTQTMTQTMTQTTTPDRVLERGDSGPGVRRVQARLRQIGWFSGNVTGFYGPKTQTAVRGFQAKRGLPVTGVLDPTTRARLVAMTRRPTGAELANRRPAPGAGAALDARCTRGRVLCVDKTSRSLRWVVDGKVRVALDARFGGAGTPTREGTFRVYWKSRNHVSSLYGSSMPYAMFFSGGQAVHYSPDFAAVGYNGASHGCVNIRDRAAIAALFDRVRVGDRVVVYRS